jgi:glyoxylase-like metal-dependent hydrolase (beta-lactamase superfamily II)
MKRLPKLLLSIALLLGTGGLHAEQDPLEVRRVADGVYALVGELAQRSPANLANNATFGAILTSEGVVLIDPGGSRKGAEQIEAALREVTELPVVLVINSGGQDHRWLGNAYFRAKGARVIASRAAVEDQQARARDQLIALDQLVGSEGMAGTETVHADEVFEGATELVLGGVRMLLANPAHAHTPGDTYVWLPEQRVVFTGDIVYVDRLLGVGPMSRSATWLQAFEAVAALDPGHVVPGHGYPTDLATARAQTYDYLVDLRAAVGALIESGAGMERVGEIDQSPYAHLAVYDEIKGRNAQAVYAEMEFE